MIYGFRGADINRFYQEAFSKKPRIFTMGQNYRSTRTVVDAAQSLIKYNHRPDEKSLFTDNEEGEKILYVNARSQAAEANYIAMQISNLVKSGVMKYSDAAILYRNSYLSRNIEDAFIKEHIPYQIVGGISFYKRMEIRDLLSFVDFINNPENISSLERIINIPKSGMGEKAVEKLASLALQAYQNYAIIDLKTALNCLRDIAETDSRLEKKISPFLRRMSSIHDWMLNSQVTPTTLLNKILVTFDYMRYLKNYDDESYDERAKNIGELINIAGTYLNLDEFLEDLFTGDGNKDKEEESDKVNMMTMHASKGLEFRIVYIIDADDSIIPSWRCSNEKDIEEERRLFYVAMTRAKENLVICSSSSMLQGGRPKYMRVSPFVNQIGKRFVVSTNV